jgi:4-diphosphocytidyl-2-C-methyl-D-erythritol kinase
MAVAVRSFAKINLGLRIGPRRSDGFHELRTIYQTIDLSDLVRVSLARGSGIEIECDHPGVPKDSTNTCYQILERALRALGIRRRVIVEIEKRIPIEGGLGGASGNAVAALLAFEKALGRELAASERLRISSAVGSDLPLFLIGGTVLGVGRGEEVYPLPELPRVSTVVATPRIRISTPRAFADWDRAEASRAVRGAKPDPLTPLVSSDRILEFSREISSWLSAGEPSVGRPKSGVSARGGGRAESPLLDLVRTGIENDFEKVVFLQHPELRKIKRVLERGGAVYASLSGSGSSVYGLFDSFKQAVAAADRLIERGVPARVTRTLRRKQIWKNFVVSG